MVDRQSRIGFVDHIRGVAIIFVVFIHVIAQELQDYKVLHRYPADNVLHRYNVSLMCVFLLGQIVNNAVPLFVINTGFLFALPGRDTTSHAFVRRIKLVIGPYVVWSVIYYLVNTRSTTLTSFVRAVATGSASFHLYYPIMLLQLYVVLWVMAKRKLTLRSQIILTLLAGLFQVMTTLLAQRQFISHVSAPTWLNWMWHQVYLNSSNNWFFLLFGVLMGRLYNDKYVDFRSRGMLRLSIGLFCFSCVVLFMESAWLGMHNLTTLVSNTESVQRISVTVYSVCGWLFLACSVTSWPALTQRLLVRLGQESYGIYLVHMLVLTVIYSMSIGSLLARPLWLLTVYYVVLAGVALLLTWLIVHVLAANSWMVVGRVSRPTSRPEA